MSPLFHDSEECAELSNTSWCRLDDLQYFLFIQSQSEVKKIYNDRTEYDKAVNTIEINLALYSYTVAYGKQYSSFIAAAKLNLNIFLI